MITQKAILSYPVLKDPQQNTNENGQPEGKPKWSAVLIHPEGTNLQELEAAIVAAADKQFPGKGAKMLASGKLRSPLRTDIEEKPGYPDGCTFFSARSTRRPGLVYPFADASGRPAKVEDDKIEEVFYPGAIVRADVTFFYYDKKGNKGIGASLNNLQKLADGERMDGRMAAEKAFDVDPNAVAPDLSDLDS